MNDTHKQLLDTVKTYKMSPAAAKLVSDNLPLIIAGTTGSGKDAIEQYIQKISDWRHVVTHTTRQSRPGEQNGVDYWFVSEEEMLALAKRQEFIEFKFLFDRDFYGSSINSYRLVLEGDHKPMMRIDVQGVSELQLYVSGLRPFFVLPPSFDSWIERLDARGHMSHVERAKRLNRAREELEMAIDNEKYVLVVNDEVPRVSREIVDGITDVASQHHNRELAQRLIDHIKAY